MFFLYFKWIKWYFNSQLCAAHLFSQPLSHSSPSFCQVNDFIFYFCWLIVPDICCSVRWKVALLKETSLILKEMLKKGFKNAVEHHIHRFCPPQCMWMVKHIVKSLFFLISNTLATGALWTVITYGWILLLLWQTTKDTSAHSSTQESQCIIGHIVFQRLPTADT